MSAAGFGLKLHDLRHGTQHHEAFDTWWDYARGAYVGLDGDTAPTTYTFYLRNTLTTGDADYIVPLGDKGDIPLVGRWGKR